MSHRVFSLEIEFTSRREVWRQLLCDSFFSTSKNAIRFEFDSNCVDFVEEEAGKGNIQIVRTPRVRERVLIEGREDVFLVVWVDPEHHVADLIPLSDGGSLEEGIPFRAIRPFIDERD